jgi:hypothetical protein
MQDAKVFQSVISPKAGKNLIIGHTTGSLGLSHLLEQKRVVALFDP